MVDRQAPDMSNLEELIEKFQRGTVSRRDFMKKLVLAGFSLSAVGAIVAACSSSSPTATPGSGGGSSPAAGGATPTAAQGAPVEITFTHWDPNQLATAFPPAVTAFNKIFPNIKVNLVQVPYAEFWSKLTTGMAAGTAPDVFVDLNNFVEQFEANNTLLDLAPYVAKDSVDLTAFAPGIVDTFKKGSGLYGLPWAVDTIGVFYNMDLLAKAGITAVPDSLTWAPDGSGTFLPFLQKLTVDKNGVTADKAAFDPNNIVQYAYGMSPDSTQSFAGPFMLSDGGGYQMALDGPPTINQAPNIETYQFIQDLMYKYHVSPPGSTVVPPNGGAESDQFLSGKVAILQTGDWYVQPFVTGAKFKLGVGALPTGPKGNIGTINGGCSSIFAGTKHPQEAWEFVKFISSTAGQQVIAGAGAVQSCLSALGTVFTDAWKAKGLPCDTLATEWTQGKVVSVPTGKNINAVQTATDNQVVNIYLNKGTVKDALDKAQADATSAYAGNS